MNRLHMNADLDAVRQGTASAVPQEQLETGALAPEVRSFGLSQKLFSPHFCPTLHVGDFVAPKGQSVNSRRFQPTETGPTQKHSTPRGVNPLECGLASEADF